MSAWSDAYKNRWREHVTSELLDYIDLIISEEANRTAEAKLAREIIRLGCAVDSAEEAAWEATMGEDM